MNWRGYFRDIGKKVLIGNLMWLGLELAGPMPNGQFLDKFLGIAFLALGFWLWSRWYVEKDSFGLIDPLKLLERETDGLEDKAS